MSAGKKIQVDGLWYTYVVGPDNTPSLRLIDERSRPPSVLSNSPGSSDAGAANSTPQRGVSPGNPKRRRLSSNRSSKAPEEEEDSDEGDESDEDEDDDDDAEGGCNSTQNHEEQEDPSIKKKRTRTYWNVEEVEVFIDILMEKHIVDKMDGKCGRLTHSSIFRNVAKALNDKKLGSKKDWKQCRLKYRKLKKSYVDCMKNNGTSGRDRDECDYFEKLNELFSKRPRITSSEWGYDSGPEANNSSAASPDGVEGSAEDSEEGTSGSPASPKQFPPKYRAGARKANSTHSLLREILERSDKSKKEYAELSEKRMEQFEKSDERLMTDMKAIFAEGFKSMTQMFMMMQQPPAFMNMNNMNMNNMNMNQPGPSSFAMPNMTEAGGSNGMGAIFSAINPPSAIPQSSGMSAVIQSSSSQVEPGPSEEPNENEPPVNPAPSSCATNCSVRVPPSSQQKPTVLGQVPASSQTRPILRASQPNFVIVRGARPLQSTSSTPSLSANQIIIRKQPVFRSQVPKN